MSPIDTALHELAGVRSDADPIVTCYLNTRWSDEQQRERVRLFVAGRIRWARSQATDGKHDAALARTLERVESYVDEVCRQIRDTEANGIAIFACEGLGLFRTLTFEQPFREQFSIGDAPQLLQLARLADDYHSVIVALVDAGGARVFETALGGLVGDSTIRHDPPSRHKMGGWSQLRYQRHVKHQIERNQKEAAEHVTFLHDEDPNAYLILVGPQRVLTQFEGLLPQRVQSRILKRLSNPAERTEGRVRDELMEQVVDELLAHERKLESRDVEAVVGEALAGGLAVLGPDDVVLAANEGRVHRLLIESDFDQTGWRCRNCEAIGIGGVISCGYCGQETTTVNLGEELGRRVLANDGEVDVMDTRPLLRHHRGIAAVLRHRGTAQAGLGYTQEQPYF